MRELPLPSPSSDGGRTRRIGLVVAACLVLGIAGAAGAGWYRTHDFYALYSGSRMLAAGLDPYDERAWCAETENTTPEAFDKSRDIAVCFMRYAYPLWTAVLLLPLGILPLPAASSIWLAFSLALFIAGLRWAWLAVNGPPSWMLSYAAIVIFSQPFALLLTLGQMGGVLFAIVAFCAYQLARGRESTPGVALALAALKPNVLPLFAAALLVWSGLARRWRFIAAAFGTGLALVAISLPPRPGWIGEWLREVFGRQIGHSVEYATAWGLAAVDLHVPAVLLIVVLAATVAIIARERLRDPVALACVAVPISTFATPYAWSYDDLVLAFPWALILALGARSSVAGRRVLLVLVLLVAVAGPWLLWALASRRHTESLTALLPAATALLAATSLRLARDGRDRSARSAKLVRAQERP